MKSRNLPKMTRDTRKKKIQTFHNDDDRNAIDGWRPSILKKLAEKHAIQYGFWFDIYHLRFVCFESFWIQVGFLFLVHHRSIGSRPKTHAYIFHIFTLHFRFCHSRQSQQCVAFFRVPVRCTWIIDYVVPGFFHTSNPLLMIIVIGSNTKLHSIMVQIVVAFNSDGVYLLRGGGYILSLDTCSFPLCYYYFKNRLSIGMLCCWMNYYLLHIRKWFLFFRDSDHTIAHTQIIRIFTLFRWTSLCALCLEKKRPKQQHDTKETPISTTTGLNQPNLSLNFLFLFLLIFLCDSLIRSSNFQEKIDW